MTTLTGWENFYVIVGSSAGALIGLQFVVMTLVAGTPMAGGGAHAIHAFSTPSVVHFAVVLALSAIACASWNGIAAVAVIWGAVGLCGIVYTATVARRMRVQTIYRPVFEDWAFHVLLPFAAYAMLAASPLAARLHARPALFVVSAAAMLLLFVGIHNAWDTVTYHVVARKRAQSGNVRDP